MAVNQKQIAKKLGVSIALVSRVLSGKAAEIGIRQDKIDAVLRVADELGYVPSAAALSLIGKSTRTIGIAVYDFNDPFFGTLIKEIQTQAHRHDYSLVLAGFLNRIPDRQDLQAFHKHSLDGMIVIGTDTAASWLDDFADMPIVRIGHGGTDGATTIVSIDEVKAALKIVSHLKSAGRSNIVYICADLPAHAIRKMAFLEAAKSLNIGLRVFGSPQRGAFVAGQEATRQLLIRKQEIDAIICATDRVAMGSLHTLCDAGISIPQQVAVTGFDDIPAASEFIPPITTIRQPVESMVTQAFKAIMDPQGFQDSPQTGKLIVRKSSSGT